MVSACPKGWGDVRVFIHFSDLYSSLHTPLPDPIASKAISHLCSIQVPIFTDNSPTSKTYLQSVIRKLSQRNLSMKKSLS